MESTCSLRLPQALFGDGGYFDIAGFGEEYARLGGSMSERRLPPTGKKGFTSAQRIDRYIEAKVERALAAERIVEFKVNLGSLTIRYIVKDENGMETLVKERITGGKNLQELEQFRTRLIEKYPGLEA